MNQQEIGLPSLRRSWDRLGLFLGLLASLLLGAAWFNGLAIVATDSHMGDVYRIIYLHVPAAICAFLMAYVLLVASLVGLKSPRSLAVFWARAAAEVGLLLTVLTLVTGSIWGYPTWGVWWTWDARITTTFLLALMNGGYLFLYNAIPHPDRRRRVCAVMAILIALDVPIIYKSVTWWRTLHQPPSIMREGGAAMDPEMLAALAVGFLAMLLFASWLVWERGLNLYLRTRVEAQSLGGSSSDQPQQT